MTRSLRPYQHLMIDWIVTHPKAALWSFMGSGKTVSVLTAIDRLNLAGALPKPTLVLAPLRVARDVWPNEAAEWDHLKHLTVTPIIGSEVQRRSALYEKSDVFTCNYENLEWLIKTWAKRPAASP